MNHNTSHQETVLITGAVAEAGYQALMRRERVIVSGGMNKVMVAGRRVMTEAAQAKKNAKYYEDAGLEERKREPGEVAAEEASHHAEK